MKCRRRIAIGTVGIATVFLLMGTVQHLLTEAPAAPHIRPMCDLSKEARTVPSPSHKSTVRRIYPQLLKRYPASLIQPPVIHVPKSYRSRNPNPPRTQQPPKR